MTSDAGMLKTLEEEALSLVGMIKLYGTAAPTAKLSVDEEQALKDDIGLMAISEWQSLTGMPLSAIQRVWTRAAAGLEKMRANGTKICAALPGTGKTTLAVRDPKFVDIDYGNWRRQWAKRKAELSPRQYARILSVFVLRVLAVGDAWECRTVFVNEIDLVTFFIHLGFDVFVVLPHQDMTTRWLGGILKRTVTRVAEHHVIGTQVLEEFEFAVRAVENHTKWFRDWEEAASHFGIALYRIDTWLPDIYWTVSGVPAFEPVQGVAGPTSEEKKKQ